MRNNLPENSTENEALALAQKGIEAGAAKRYDDAVVHWRAASVYADAHLPGADIDYWIKSGLGAALYDTGAYEESIAVSKLALDWCSALKQPLPALTMARSYRRLGDHAAAQASIEHARNLVGDSVLADWDVD
jgi:tetratricopeptide (TPR) repeat protein